LIIINESFFFDLPSFTFGETSYWYSFCFNDWGGRGSAVGGLSAIGIGGGLFVVGGKSYVNVGRSRIKQKFGLT
jgi:hypothetical protein